jgi:indolepyruvate ferredoxin oxidoreductase beta subunit
MDTPQPIKIAILAMGGEGGGVLADWIVDLAEHNGYLAQTTSVPGVAQRTGATIYYVELFPKAAADAAGAAPVLALMPLPGDVDIVLASELMEAARAVQRGLVTAERTTLIASTHRVYAIAEKVAPGDGRADAQALLASARDAARRFVGFDMAALAADQGSVISAVLFGALAAAGGLPFGRAAFEATVERGGVGVRASLAAFAAAFERASHEGVPAVAAAEPAGAAPRPRQPPVAGAPGAAEPALPHSAQPQIRALLQRAAQAHAGETLAIVVEGLRRTVDYQDPAYAALYLDRLDAVPGPGELKRELARHLALAMSYEDAIRVADLKTRDSRFERVRAEVKPGTDQLLQIHEFMHPRLQEIADVLPAALGRRLLAPGLLRGAVERFTREGRTVHTSGVRGHLLLHALAGFRRWRRRTLRFAAEQARIEAWLADIRRAAEADPARALEIVRCQRLLKGYGDTHERGSRKYDAVQQVWRAGASAQRIAALREAALADEDGQALQAELQRVPQAA